MKLLSRGPTIILFFCFLLEAQQPVAIQKGTEREKMPSSGGYKPPALSWAELLESDSMLQGALMSFMQTGDSSSYRNTMLSAAKAGNIGAQLILAEQYVPQQCPSEPNRDVPHCGQDGKEPPNVPVRKNPLGLESSYEEATRWLEKASAQGSGEASEELAQLITRMQTNGHGTAYKAADSARLHALARSQGFEVEPIEATCYKIIHNGSGIKLESLPAFFHDDSLLKPFTDAELAALHKAGVSGRLEYGGGMNDSGSVLLSRPEGPVAHIRIILDHNPGYEVLLPIPAHRDVIYLQQGDAFLAFPGGGSILPRFISLSPLDGPKSEISLFVQHMDGAYSGGSCPSFP